MFDLVHAGFDTMDIAFSGALPQEALSVLEKAREVAQERQAKELVSIGPGNLAMHVAGHVMKGGYAYVTDTGPLGAVWRFKKNADPTQWNIFASPRATMLLAYGFKGTRERLLAELKAMGAMVTDHSINRVDFAMDFRTQGFKLHMDQFVAHSHCKITPHWEKKETFTDRNQPTAVIRGRQFESATIGRQPGRQIIVYDKRREAIEHQKPFWFAAWGIDRKDPTAEVWRVEVRAGKKELKDKYRISRFEDLEAGIGDVMVNALQEVRYLADRQRDSNVSRQALHPLWLAAQAAVANKLTDYRSGLTPNQVIEIERTVARDRYAGLVTGNAIGLAVADGLADEEIMENLPQLVADYVATAIRANEAKIAEGIRRTRVRQHFIDQCNI